MVLDEGGAEEFAVDVGVDFGGGDGFVAKHFLDGAEVGTAFDEMGGEGVPEMGECGNGKSREAGSGKWGMGKGESCRRRRWSPAARISKR